MISGDLKFNSNFNVSYNLDKNTSTKLSSDFKSESEQEITSEEDKILYENLKKAGVDFKDHSFEWEKEHLVGFPPLTAPGNVRRAYRLALENATPEEKRAAQGMMFYMQLYKKNENIGDNQNSVSDYLNLMNGFKGYFDSRYSNVLSQSQYDSYNSLISKFTSELSKY
ncbi:hypothetical protein ACSVC9_13060 [Clostridium sp. LBM24168]